MKRFEPYETEEMAEILRNDGVISVPTDTVYGVLLNDGVISVPTDTVYGVCARMDSYAAQQKLRDIKHRPADKQQSQAAGKAPGQSAGC